MKSLKISTLRQCCLAAKLAFKDMVHGYGMTLCLVAAIAAIIAPLLLLLGLRTGIVDTMRDRLLSDPAALELKIYGNWSLSQEWIDDIRHRSETAFIIPITRSINAEIDLVKNSSSFVKSVEIVPSGEGDPVLQRYEISHPTAFDRIILSSSVARSLDVEVGDVIYAVVKRKVDGKLQTARTALTIEKIGTEELTGQKKIFAQLDLLMNVERYLDAQPAPMFTGEKEAIPFDRFSRARIYAKSLDQVKPLAEYIRSTHVEVDFNADQIQSFMAIEKSSRLVLQIVIGISIIGGIVTLIGFIITKIENRRVELSIMRMIGFSGIGVATFPITQTMFIGIAGLMFSLGLYWVGEQFFYLSFGQNLNQNEYISVLPAKIVGVVFLCVVGITYFAAGLGGLYAAKIDPSEPLRDS